MGVLKPEVPHPSEGREIPGATAILAVVRYGRNPRAKSGDGVIREVAGHVDPAMTRHYSHPRLAARRAAVEVLSTVKARPTPSLSEGGYVTSHVTKALPKRVQVG
jgi:hypothetical protein